MTAYWFSNRCPFFSAFHAELYCLKFGEEGMTSSNLVALSFFKAAQWLEKHKELWDVFEKNIPDELKKISDYGGGVLYWGEENYPQRLTRIYYPPAVLIYKGDIQLLSRPSVAVVGARAVTNLGRQWVQLNMAPLCKEGVVIVSGGARGIDYEAHWSALTSGGKTVAYLPGGIIRPYPRDHGFLFDEISKSKGLIVSEYCSADPVRKENFHKRNRLIAGSSHSVVIVEAKSKSGTWMTATHAISENIEVLVVPGSPLLENYAGSLDLISQGSVMVRSAADIISSLEKRNVLKKPSDSPNLS